MVLSKFIAVPLVAVALHGCQPQDVSKALTASPTFVCLKVKQYSKAEQNRAADELEAYADRIPVIAGWISDYGSVRKALRAKCPGN